MTSWVRYPICRFSIITGPSPLVIDHKVLGTRQFTFAKLLRLSLVSSYWLLTPDSLPLEDGDFLPLSGTNLPPSTHKLEYAILLLLFALAHIIASSSRQKALTPAKIHHQGSYVLFVPEHQVPDFQTIALCSKQLTLYSCQAIVLCHQCQSLVIFSLVTYHLLFPYMGNCPVSLTEAVLFYHILPIGEC